MADDPKSSDAANPSDPVEAAISAASAAGRKRSPPTLDLTATDTTPASEPPPPDAVIESPLAAEAMTVPPSESPAPKAPVADAVAPEPFAAGDQLPPPPSATSVPPGRSSFGGSLAAGMIGAALSLIIIGALWLAGLFGADTSLLTDRTARLETQLRSISERPATTAAPAFDVGKLDDVSKRIAALESRLAPTGAAPDATLAGRIASLEGTIKTLSGRLDAAATTARETAQAQSATPAVPPAEIEALGARISTLDSGIKSLQEDVAKRLNAGIADQTARRAVAAEALRVAVERGGPFARELKAAQPIPGENLLQPFAQQGVPNAQVLARELTALLPALRAAQPAAPNNDAGFMEKLSANAQKLVRVRRVNEAAGDDPAATLSRIEVRAQSADIDGVLAELNKLPPEARAPAADWISKAQARRDAVQAARQFAADSLDQIGTR